MPSFSLWQRLTARPAVLPLAVFVLAFGLRAGWAGLATVTPVSDCRGYDRLAQGLAAGEPFGVHQGVDRGRAYRTPGYPAFLALVYALFGHSLTAAALAQALVGGLTAALLFLLARRSFGPEAALLAALLYTFSPTFLAFVPILASETLATGLGLASLLLLAHALGGGPDRPTRAVWAWLAGAGGLIGLNLLVRPAGLFFVPGLLLAIGLQPGWSWPRRGAAGLVLVAALLAVLAPWLIRNAGLGYGLSLSSVGGLNLYMGNNDRATDGGYHPARLEAIEGEHDAERDRRYRAAAIDWILGHPGRYARLSLVRLWRLIGTQPESWAAQNLWPSRANDELVAAAHATRRSSSPDRELIERYHRQNASRRALLRGVQAILAPLGLLGLGLAFARWRRFLPILAPWCSYVVGLSLTIVATRYRMPAEPLLWVLVGGLLADVLLGKRELGWPARRRTKLWAALAAVGSFVLLEGLGALSALERLAA